MYKRVENTCCGFHCYLIYYEALYEQNLKFYLTALINTHSIMNILLYWILNMYFEPQMKELRQ